MRVTGIMPDKERVGELIDSLKISGFERQDMIITDMEKSFTQRGENDDTSYLKTESESLVSRDPYTDFLTDEVSQGIVIAVEASKHQSDRVRTIMKENGAIKIILE